MGEFFFNTTASSRRSLTFKGMKTTKFALRKLDGVQFVYVVHRHNF